MDKYSKKLKILKELDSETDWEALIKKNMSSETAQSTSKQKAPIHKLTKSEKKRRILEKQHEKVQASIMTKNVETIVFNNPDAIQNPLNLNKQPIIEQTSSNAQVKATGIEINMRETRFEVMKFGMDSLKDKDLEDAETSLAISLGAKPTKRPSINYKELQSQRKIKKELEKEEATTSFKPDPRAAGKKKKPQAVGKGAKQDKTAKQVGGRSVGRNSKNPRSRNRK